MLQEAERIQILKQIPNTKFKNDKIYKEMKTN